MLIRSQDKKVIVNLQSISQFYIVHGDVVADFNNADNSQNGYVTLGLYDDAEKATKVLDLIQKNYENLEAVHHGFGVGDCSEVFQMPQDSEVIQQ